MLVLSLILKRLISKVASVSLFQKRFYEYILSYWFARTLMKNGMYRHILIYNDH